MKIFITLFIVSIAASLYSQDLPKDYYAPFKTINYKEGSSFGYFQLNLSPSLYSSFKASLETPLFPSSTTTTTYYKEYSAELLGGLSNTHFELYQYWNIKNKSGMEFSFWKTNREYTFSHSKDYNPDDLPIFINDYSFTFTKSDFTGMIGWVMKEPISMGLTIGSKSFQIANASHPNGLYNIDFTPVTGGYFKVGTAINKGKDKRRFGIYEVFGVQYAGSGTIIEKPALISYLNLYGYIRLFSTSKPIRQLGIIFTFLDFTVNYDRLMYDNSQKEAYGILDIPLNFGIGLAW